MIGYRQFITNLLRLYQMNFDIFFTGAIFMKQPAVLPETAVRQDVFFSKSAFNAQGTVSEVEIKKFHVNSNIQIRYAITDVEAEMQNIHNDTWKAVFDMIIPKEAFVSKFVMVINGKIYEAKVKTKEVASSIFDSSEVTSGLVQSTTPPEFIDGNQVSKSKNECQTQNEKLLKAAGNIKLLGIKTESITVL